VNLDAIDDLIQTVLEGDASPVDTARLEQLVATDPRVRERLAELSLAFEALSQGPQLEAPPDDLRASILAEIRRQHSPATKRAGSPALRPGFSWFRLALPLAACAAAVIVLVWNGQSPPPIPAGGSTSGTMGVPTAQVIRLGEGDRATALSWHRAGAHFSLEIRAGRTPPTVVLEPRQVRLEEGSGPLVLGANELDTVRGEIEGDSPSVLVTLRWADGRSDSAEVSLLDRSR
jgi:hypothetical protein